MDKSIIKNWNKKVKKDDLVYHLGDFGDSNKVKKLNGKIILILGNYEKDDMKKLFQNNFKEYKKHLLSFGFFNVYKNNLKIKIDNLTVNLTHKPLDCRKNSLNLFGHIHSLRMINPFGLNVGIDAHNYYPVEESDVLFFLNAIHIYDKNVFCDSSDLKR